MPSIAKVRLSLPSPSGSRTPHGPRSWPNPGGGSSWSALSSPVLTSAVPLAEVLALEQSLSRSQQATPSQQRASLKELQAQSLKPLLERLQALHAARLSH